MIDLAQWIRPDDLVVWGQACAEPTTLVEALVTQLPATRCFVGIPGSVDLRGLNVYSYCGSGTNASLPGLQIVPVHYSALPRLLTAGPLRADVVFVQVSATDATGRHSLGLADDYFSAALDTARVVIAEVNDQVPFVPGARTLTAADWTASISVSRPPVAFSPGAVSPQMRAVASRVAALVPDGATLQYGIGALPDAVLGLLTGHNDLGFHSGILTDAARTLISSGVATGARKSHDRGVAVGGLLMGGPALFEWADRNPGLALRSTAYTHDPAVLATSHRLVAINSAIEVDLTGQVNAETVGSRYVGAVGGAVDFFRGAAASPGGIPIVALPSTARGASRIVRRLSGPTSTSRAEPLVVVTEHGVADLRGLPIPARIEAMLAIADPAFVEELREGLQ